MSEDQEEVRRREAEYEYRWMLEQIENDKFPVLHNGGWMDKVEALQFVSNYEKYKNYK